jgi:hypothetical protein
MFVRVAPALFTDFGLLLFEALGKIYTSSSVFYTTIFATDEGTFLARERLSSPFTLQEEYKDSSPMELIPDITMESASGLIGLANMWDRPNLLTSLRLFEIQVSENSRTNKRTPSSNRKNTGDPQTSMADSKKKRDAPETEPQTQSLPKKPKDIYYQLDKLLGAVDFKYFDMIELVEGESEDIQAIQASLEQDGVVILKNAVPDDVCHITSRCAVGSVIYKMFKWQLTKVERAHVLDHGSIAIDHKRNCKDLGHGNASFGFIFKHLRSSYPRVTIGGEKIEFDLNFSYYANISLLDMHPYIFGLLYALCGQRCEVSRDALKDVYSSSPKPKAKTKPTLTKMHIDKYDSNVEARIQAMVMAEEGDDNSGSIRLGFVPGANLPAVRELINQLEPSIYTRVGFNGIRDPKLVEVLGRHLVAAPYGALVIWKDGLPHAEANFIKAEDDIFRFQSYEEVPNQQRNRYVVGVHQGRDKTQKETLLLANLAYHGLTHAVYSPSNKRSAYGRANMVDSKTTQWKKPREVPPEEDQFIKDAVALAVREVEEYDPSEVVGQIGKFRAWMMGVDCYDLDGTENDPDIVKRWTHLRRLCQELYWID